MKYSTQAGDTFDLIAYRTLGEKYLGQVLEANPTLLETFEFKAGVSIEVPTVEEPKKISLPPWRS